MFSDIKFARTVLIIILVMVTSCGVKLKSEKDLKRRLTIDEAEVVLGSPFYERRSKNYVGRREVRYYMSDKTNRIYAITYWDGYIDEIEWKDASEVIASIKDKVSPAVTFGQTKNQVRESAGAPSFETGTPSDTQWWYVISPDEIYLLRFYSGILTNLARSVDPGVLDYLKRLKPQGTP